MNETVSDIDVLIVGGGPAGMTMALCLAARGVPSLVVERNAAISEHPKAHELNTRSIEIMHELGITVDELSLEASPDSDGSRILFCKSINEEFGRIDLLEDGGSAQKYSRHFRSKKPFLNLSQVEFEKVLVRHAEAESQIEVHFDHEWTSFANADAEPTVVSVIRDRTTGEESRVRSRFVIAADGASSPIRKSLGIEMKGPAQLQDFINVYFEHDLRPHVATPAKLYWVLHPAAPGAFIAHHMEKRWTYNMPLASPWESRDDYPDEVLRERIVTALGFDPGIEIRSVSYWRMTVQIAERYREGRVFLVGDSAHRFPPTGGLGMNTGIADAHNLSWKIATVLHNDAPARLLDSYEQERKPVAARNAQESEANFDKIFEVIEAFGLPRHGLAMTARLQASRLFRLLPAFLHRAVLGVVRWPAHQRLGRFHRDPATRARVRASIADQLGHFDRIGLDIGYVYQSGAVLRNGVSAAGGEAVAYSVTEYDPSTQPGARFPHLDLTPRGDANHDNSFSSHDLIDYRALTLLTASDLDDWRRAADQLSDRTGLSIRVVPLKQLEASEQGLQELESLCEIGPDGALLVRPDGHVAWRAAERPPNPTAALQEVAELLALSKPAASQ